MTNQKNVCCYTSTYTVSSFSHNSRNSRLMFVLTPALSWFTRKTQQKKSEALSQAPEPLQRHKPLIPGSLGSYSAQVFLFSQISYNCSVEAVKNTTLCKLHNVSKGSNTDQFSQSHKSLRKLTRPSPLSFLKWRIVLTCLASISASCMRSTSGVFSLTL